MIKKSLIILSVFYSLVFVNASIAEPRLKALSVNIVLGIKPNLLDAEMTIPVIKNAHA